MKLPQEDSNPELRTVDIWIILIVFAFALYHSILYFGYQVVPNPDFTGFIRVGRELLSFQLPTSFKRAPVLGILQVLLSNIIDSKYPDLIAGWLLNAILHPFSAVLLYLIGRRIIGRWAVWFALILTVNPWVIQMLIEPIAETTLLFFVLLSFFFLFRRSRWVYVFASITTMVRYEGAALIFIAFIIDIIYERSWRARLRAFLYSALASIPLMLWLIGTFLSFSSEGKTHYLKELGAAGQFSVSFKRYIELLWQVSIYPLFCPAPDASKATQDLLSDLSKFATATTFALGFIYAVMKKHWQILSMLMFLILYLLVHSAHSFVLPRFCIIVYWIVVFVCLYGLRSMWQSISDKARIPRFIVLLVQVVVVILAVLWLIQIVPFLGELTSISSRSASVPWVGIAAAVLIFLLYRIISHRKYLFVDLTAVVLVSLMFASNQCVLVPVIGDGKIDIEFKLLAEWYLDSAKPGEKMVTTMANIVRIFAPEYGESFIHIAQFSDANSPADFVRRCYEEDITYVVWDSRLGLTPKNRYYKLWHLDNIAALAYPRDVGPYKFVTQIRANRRRFINIFRLSKPQVLSEPTQ